MDATDSSTGHGATLVDSQDDCDFFRLPRELRDIIYGYVFGDGIVKSCVYLKYAYVYAPQSAMTLTCRRVHGEASAIHQGAYATFWSKNTFHFVHSFAYDQPVLTTKKIKHMMQVLQIKSLGNCLLITMFRSCPGQGQYDLVCEYSDPDPVLESLRGHRVSFERRDSGDWLRDQSVVGFAG